MRVMFVALAAAFLATSAAAAPPHVSVTGGMIEGQATNDALIFQSIPFAAPPLGDLRWKAPQPVIAWQGVRNATTPPKSCPQTERGWNHFDYINQSEDCLTINVQTQSLEGKRPVIVWIHGGANRAGSAGFAMQSSFAQQGVVFVALQYRLGALGFLAPRGAATETGGTAGNYGVMDQIAALKWVQANIAKFGGDPTNVTIMGESAGSQDVSFLMAAPAARGLFGKAIMESGTPNFGAVDMPLAVAHTIADQMGNLLGTGNDIAKMRKVALADILAVDDKLTDPFHLADWSVYDRAVIDGAILTKSPRALLEAAPARPLLIGTNRAELSNGADAKTRVAQTELFFGKNAASAKVFYHLDQPEPSPDPRMGDLAMEMSTDLAFRCPAGRIADIAASKGAPVWRYEFDLSKDGGITSHAAEIPFVFSRIQFVPNISMQDYWAHFAKTGNPNSGTLPNWSSYTTEAKKYVLFDKSGVTEKANLRGEICALIDRI